MDIRNKILILSDIPQEIATFRRKLSILKSTNLIFDGTIEEAYNTSKKFIPDVVVAFVDRYKINAYNDYCKLIKANSILKNTSIIFIFEEQDKDLILSCFDAGISDFIINPISDIDIFTRIIWAFQRKEFTREIEKKNEILKYLQVIDNELDVYRPEHVNFVLTNEINTANKYKYPIVLMAISLDPQFDNKTNIEYLANIIKKSTRKSDVVGFINNNNYYLLLHRSNINGAHTVYNKVLNNIGELSISVGMSVGICESYNGMNFESISDSAKKALEEAVKRGGNRMVVFNQHHVTEDGVESKLNKFKMLENELDDTNNSTKNWLNKISLNKKKYEFFSDEFTKKVGTIVSPVFIQIQNHIRQNYKGIFWVEQFTTDTKCFFSVRELSVGNEAELLVLDPGTAKVVIDYSFLILGTQKSKRLSLEIDELTQQNLEQTIVRFFNEFEKLNELSKTYL